MDDAEKVPAPQDALYVLQEILSSSDGRPPGTTRHEITFSADGIFGYTEMGVPSDPNAINQTRALAALTGCLALMHKNMG